MSQSSVKFCVIEVFKFWVRCRYEENKEWKYPKLGDAQGTPRSYTRKIQAIKLGDAPEGIPSFVSNIIGNLTWSYIFIHHMIWVLLGASIYFVTICLILFRIMFCIFYFNKMWSIAFAMLILQVYMLLFQNRKFIAVAKIL